MTGSWCADRGVCARRPLSPKIYLLCAYEYFVCMCHIPELEVTMVVSHLSGSQLVLLRHRVPQVLQVGCPTSPRDPPSQASGDRLTSRAHQAWHLEASQIHVFITCVPVSKHLGTHMSRCLCEARMTRELSLPSTMWASGSRLSSQARVYL